MKPNPTTKRSLDGSSGSPVTSARTPPAAKTFVFGVCFVTVNGAPDSIVPSYFAALKG